MLAILGSDAKPLIASGDRVRETASIAKGLTKFDPDDTWKKV